MAGWLLRRLAGRLILWGLAASMAYLLAASVLHPRAELEAGGGGARPPQAVVDARLDALGVNDRAPLTRRYLAWATGLARGDLGETMDGSSVGTQLRRRVGVSLRLMTAGVVLGTLLGVLAGVTGVAGVGEGTDGVAAAVSFVILSLPEAVTAVVLQTGAQWVNTRAGARIFVWTGPAAAGPPGGALCRLGDQLRHLLLPTIALAAVRAAHVGRHLRVTLAEAAHAGLVRAAMAKGLSRRRAILRHALPVAVIPVVPVSAYGCAGLLAGSAATETVFAWHGTGEWLTDAIRRADVNAVAAYCCYAAMLVLAAGLASDLLIRVMDPRQRR